MNKVEVALAILAALTVGILAGCIAGAATFDWRSRRPPAVNPVPPRVAGALAPDSPSDIDFSRPHDFHFGRGWAGGTGEPLVLRSCRLIGFTSALLGGGAAGDATLVWSQTRHGSHGRWLVFVRPVGRRVYAPADALVRVEECAATHEQAPTQTP